jgi:hypothetical protein
MLLTYFCKKWSPEILWVVSLSIMGINQNLQIFSQFDYHTFSNSRYKIALLTNAMFNYTDFKTTLVCVPLLFIIPYIAYSNKYFVHKFDPETGIALNDDQLKDQMSLSNSMLVYFGILSILN